jgi:hypothetical protein
MSQLRRGFTTVAVVSVVAVVVAGCSVASEERSGPGADGVPVVVVECAEEVADCDDTLITGEDTVIDGTLPPAPTDGEGQEPVSSGFVVDGGIDIPDAIAYEGTEVVAVRGYFVAGESGARLCEALAESYPPQCGGVSVAVANPELLSHVVLVEEGGTQWSEDYITVLGQVVAGELTIAADVSG